MGENYVELLIASCLGDQRRCPEGSGSRMAGDASCADSKGQKIGLRTLS